MTGGFADKNGVALTQGGGTLLVYHAYAATDGHFQLHVADFYWDDSGWPVTTPSPQSCCLADRSGC